MIIVLQPDRIEDDLAAGEIGCPGCGAPMRGWSWARSRRIRQLDGSAVTMRPRRARCRACRATHVLMPASCLPRRADSAEAVGKALLARVLGRGYRSIAADLHRPVGTVRGWFTPLSARHLSWLTGRGAQHIYRHDQELLTDQPAHGDALADAVESLGRAVVAFRRRFPTHPAQTWPLITIFTSGRLLGPTPPT